MTDTFQWQRCDSLGASCSNIVGATGSVYTLVTADVGNRLKITGAKDGITATPALTPIIQAAGASPSGDVYWGARIDGGFYYGNSHYPGTPNADDAPWSGNTSGASWDLFESHAGKAVTCIHWGATISSLPSAFDTTADSIVRSRGAFSMYGLSASTTQVNDLAANSNAHGAITMLQNWATAVAGTGRPILVRIMHEMNGNWGYPWQTGAGISAATYVAAFRRMVTIIRAIAPNVSIFWCPNIWSGGGVPDPTPWFPGTGYVDWVGFDGYNQNTSGYDSPATVFNTTYATVIGLAPGLPVGIGEVGCAAPTGSPGKAAWITDFLSTWVPAHPYVKLVMWFNEAGNPALPHIEVGDSSTTYGGAAQSAFATAIADSSYIDNIVDSGTFPSNALVPIP